MLNHKKPKGFTIIELLIATLVFSIVLVVVLAAFVQTSRLYYKGVNMDNTQEDTRVITQDIADDIKFAQSSPSSFSVSYNSVPGNTGQFCIGLHRYSYQIGSQVGSGGAYGIKRDNISTAAGCPSTAVLAGTNPEQLLDSGMQLNAVSINCSNGRCTIDAHVVFYGTDNSVLYSPSSDTRGSNAPDAECTGQLQSSQFCSVADFDRTVTVLQG